MSDERVSTNKQKQLEAIADAFLADASNYDLNPLEALIVLGRLAGFFQNELLKVDESLNASSVGRSFAMRVAEELERFRTAKGTPPLVLVKSGAIQ